MIARIAAAGFSLLTAGGPAHQVDFQLVPQAAFNSAADRGGFPPGMPMPLNGAVGAVAVGESAIDEGDPGFVARRHWHRRRGSSRPSAQTARGFGNDVPLSFAMRQIVPDGIEVTYGPDVDQDATVDWVGGRPWDSVVRTTIAPLGLHAVIRGRVVNVTKP